MMRFAGLLLVLLLAGCEKAPAPTGPSAAEAAVADKAEADVVAAEAEVGAQPAQ
jgi:hypothetical protein